MTAPASGATDQQPGEPPGWHRLDPRLVALHLSFLAPPVAGFAGTAVITGGDIPGRAYGTLISVSAIFLLLVVAGLVRYATTRYRITAERVELHTGLMLRRQLSIPRDRIRSVDLTANPLHRVFGLSVVKVGTGQGAGSQDTTELSLDAVTREHADDLRRQLLYRTPPAQPTESTPTDTAAPATTATTATTATETTGDGEPIATIQWAWIRYAPLTAWTLVIAVILSGTAYRVLEAIGIEPWRLGFVRAAFEQLLHYSIIAIILAGLVVVLVVGVIGATLIYVESWWGYRLTRDGGVFRIKRGLLTTRSVSLEERRLRGVEIVEPIMMRWAGGAETKVIAAGLATKHNDKNKDKDALLPPAPLPEAHRVSAQVLAEDETPVAVTDLTGHPRAALRRRLVRAVVVPVVLAAALGLTSLLVSWWPTWPVLIALGLIVLTVPFAVDAYRNLGHALTERYLVTRYGSAFRSTVGLRRSGVIGWTVSRTYFQRRSGLATIAATTGAGGGAYKILDVEESEGLRFAEQAVPDLLTPFLER